MNDESNTAEELENAVPEPTPASSKGGSERRRAPRAKGDFAVRVHGSEAGDSRIKDLSTNGLCCFHDDPIDEMQMVQISLEIPGDIPAPESGAHEVKGAVVRCDPRTDGEPGFEIAIYFTEIPSLTKLAIDGWVKANPPA
ncbi:MAG: PilZ domain-containing protein [Planctomycetota bacterium]